MISSIKRPIGFVLLLLAFGLGINKLLEYSALHPYLNYVIGSLVAIIFTFLFAWLLQVSLSKNFRYTASSYAALLLFVVSVIAILGALFFKPEILEFKGAIETMPLFMSVLIAIGLSAINSVVYWGILYLMITFGNWLASFVVKRKEVL